MSVAVFVRLESSLSTFGSGHIGAPLSVVAGSLLGVAMSVAAFAQIGSTASVFGAVSPSDISLAGRISLGSSSSVRNRVRFGSSLRASGTVASQSRLDRLRVLPRSFVLGAPYPVSALLVLMTISA